MPNSFLDPLNNFSDLDIGPSEDKDINSLLQLFKHLFDTIQTQPLTDEQRLACIDNSQCQLLVAAAGSGKTSTMVGKVAYSIASGQLKPQEILVLAFNVSAAHELSQRISSSLFNSLGTETIVKTSTLHALGLQIIRSCNADIKVLNDVDNKKIIQKLINKLCKTDAEFADNYLLFLSFYYANFAYPYDFNTNKEWYTHVRNNGFKLNKYYGFLTIKGELVFTQFELAIANWLYAHGISYQYKYKNTSRLLRHILPSYRYGNLKYQAYFLLEDYGIKIHCVANLSDKNFIKYKRKQKSNLRANNSSKLRDQLFLSSQQFAANLLFKHLKHIFNLLGIKLSSIDLPLLRKQHSYLSELFLNEYQQDFLQGFIRANSLMFDQKNIDKSDCITGINKATNNSNTNPLDVNRVNIHQPFLHQLCSYFANYLKENNLTDFEGMLINAAQYVKSGLYNSQYKLILVDEFQDTSGASINLLLALLKQNPANKIFTVGDDWQSIYGFAGAIPDVMFNFSNYFDNYDCTVNHLTNTFRFNQHIADLASNFVQANPQQIKKQVLAHIKADLNSIKLRYCNSTYAMYLICHQCLLQINRDLLSKNKGTDIYSVYILGRYKHQQPPELNTWQNQLPRLNISFSTVHAAKGMQADAVIILGLHTGKYGFPSQIKSDFLHTLVSSSYEEFPYAQERRLFYVALTRTKGDVYLLAGKRSPSPFIAEVASCILPENII